MRSSQWLCGLLLLTLAACGPEKPPSPKMKVGRPYEIDGTMYYPKYESSYNKTGMASWYGPGFHGKKTANGEEYDANDLTAAHPTLPMPSIVKVTNLKNNKSVYVRVNDRGPFKSKRIIDLSKASAQRIDMPGTSKVRVEYLPKETEDYIAQWESKGAPPDMFAYNDKMESASTQFASAEPVAQPQSEQKSGSSFFGLISDAQAQDSAGSISSSDLPAPGKVSAASVTQPVPQPLLSESQRAQPVHIRDADDVPFTRGPSVPEQDEVKSAAPYKPAEAVKVAVPTGGEYYIQAGVFSHKDNAEHLKDKLTSLAGATMDKVERPSGALWRVRVGPFVSKSAAEEALSSVHQHVPDAKITH